MSKQRFSHFFPISTRYCLYLFSIPTIFSGLINCHVRDGAALVSYFAWLEKELANGTNVTEISGADRLEEFRK